MIAPVQFGPVVTAAELARLCGVSRRSVFGWIERGELGRAWRLGRNVMISGPAATRFLQTRTYRRRECATPRDPVRGVFISKQVAA